jgi:hypothetical protein
MRRLTFTGPSRTNAAVIAASLRTDATGVPARELPGLSSLLWREMPDLGVPRAKLRRSRSPGSKGTARLRTNVRPALLLKLDDAPDAGRHYPRFGN